MCDPLCGCSLILAARFFMAAVEDRKWVVFSMVAALVAVGANYRSLKSYFKWNLENSGCQEKLPALHPDRVAESAVKKFAQETQAWLETTNAQRPWNVSARAEGRAIIYTFRLKEPITDQKLFISGMKANELETFESHCFKNPAATFFRIMKVTQAHTVYSSEGKWLWSFTVSPADCPHG
jgi:hypothetical protein